MEAISIISSIIIAVASAFFQVWLDKNWHLISSNTTDRPTPDKIKESKSKLGERTSNSAPRVSPAYEAFSFDEEYDEKVEEKLEVDYPILRIVVVLCVSFITALFCAYVGDELGGTGGIIIGLLSGLLLSILAGWAAYQIAIAIAKTTSILALIAILFIVLSGIVFGLSHLIGFSVRFTDSMVCTGILLVLLVGSLAQFLGKL